MQLICHQCQAHYTLNREIPANATFQCRKCQHKFKAVASPEAPAAVAAPTVPAPPAVVPAVAVPVTPPVAIPIPAASTAAASAPPAPPRVAAKPTAAPPQTSKAPPPPPRRSASPPPPYKAPEPPVVYEAQVYEGQVYEGQIYEGQVYEGQAHAVPANTEPAGTDEFLGINVTAGHGGSTATNTAAAQPASNSAPAPLSFAERRARQKQKNQRLLFACVGVLFLLAAGGVAFYFLRDPKTPVAKSSDDPAKAAAKQPNTEEAAPAEPEKNTKASNKAAAKSAAKHTAEKTEPTEPTEVVVPAAKAPAAAKAKEIKLRAVTFKLAEPVRRWHIATSGKTAAAASDKGEVDGYGLTKPAHIWTYEDAIGVGMGWKVSAVAFSAVASTTTQQPLLLVSGNLMSDEVFLVSLDASDGKEMGQYRALKGPANFLLFHPSKPNLLLAGLANDTGSLQLLNLNEDKPVAELLNAHESAIRGLAISADGERCVTTSSKAIEGKDQPGSVLTTWSLTDVGREKEYTDFAGNASAVSMSLDGKLIAVHEAGETTGMIQVLKFPELELVTKIPGVAATVPAGQQLHAFVPGEDLLLAAVGEDLVYFNARTGEKQSILPKVFAEQAHSLLVSPDGKVILTTSGEKDFRLWRMP